MSKTVHRSLEAKLAALQGPEWDSSDEETPMIPLESNKKRVPTKASVTKTKTKKKLKKPKQSRVIYIGHLPRSFEEPELLGFLSQFGVVTKVKLSRSRKTANPKGFCFCEFANSEVASIVAETMNGYFLQDKRLVCHVVPLEKIRPNLFDGHDRAFTKVDWQAKHANEVNKEKSPDVMNVITKRLLAREEKKKAALKAMGIEYDYPGYKSSAEIVEQATTSTTLETTGAASSGNKKKRRKESMEEQENVESTKKKQRSISEASDGSAKKKKQSRKDSIDSLGSSSSGKKEKKSRKDSIGSHDSLSDKKKNSKRKDSVDSHGSSSEKKKTRRDSMDSLGSTSSKTKHSKRTSTNDMQPEDTPKPKVKSSRKHGAAKTEMKKKKKTEKKRRAST